MLTRDLKSFLDFLHLIEGTLIYLYIFLKKSMQAICADSKTYLEPPCLSQIVEENTQLV